MGLIVWLDWLMGWSVFNTNLSNISAILLHEQIFIKLLNLDTYKILRNIWLDVIINSRYTKTMIVRKYFSENKN